ncbi:MAG: XdhC family protein [Clostridiales bacterium]|nr:XdhC family protein [Clostridiales bacterium]
MLIDDAVKIKGLFCARDSIFLSQGEMRFIPNAEKLISDAEVAVLELFLPKPRLVILGCGYISIALSKIAPLIGFQVWAYDDRPSFAAKHLFPDADKVICDSFMNLEEHLKLGQNDYVAVMTRGHRHDIDCLRFILRADEPFYLGMLASKRRAAIVAGELLSSGASEEMLSKLHSPIGLSLGSVTPEEIAVSIAAELIREKRRVEWEQQIAIDAYADLNILEFLAGCSIEKAAIITVAKTSGSTPREAGAKMAVLESGMSIGTIGGGCAEAEAVGWARDVIGSGGFMLKTIDMSDISDDDGMACGGSMEIIIERVE